LPKVTIYVECFMAKSGGVPGGYRGGRWPGASTHVQYSLNAIKMK